MTLVIRSAVAAVTATAIAALLSGCGSSPSGSGDAGNPSRAGSGPTSPAGTATTTGTSFRLEEGFEHDVCGIGISVKFIPATATSSKADFAVLFGGPVSNVPDKVQNHTGDEPLPDNAAHAVANTTVTVYGKQFKVAAVDPGSSSVQLTALC